MSEQNQGSGKRMSMRDKILAMTDGVSTAGELRDVLDDAKGCEASQEIVDRFVDLMDEVNNLAVHNLSREMSRRDAQGRWDNLSWNEREDLLVEWAEAGDTEVEKRLEKIPAFYEDTQGKVNVPTKIFLREIVDQFAIPLRWIHTLPGLEEFLDELAEVKPPKIPLVTKLYKPDFVPDDAIRLGKDGAIYLPKRGATKIARAWPLIKKVEAMARELESKMNALRAKATPNLTPGKISEGKEGNLFVFLSGKEGVLLQAVRQEDNRITVKVIESVGLEESQLPQEPQQWSKKRHEPVVNTGKWTRICKALTAWKTRMEESAKARKQARDNFLAPLTRPATIPFYFEKQGLTRILKGEQGTVALWRDRFQWGKKTEFFGIAVEHCENGSYVLKAVVSDHKFPKELVGQELPLEVDHDAPSARLRKLPMMEQALWNGLRMVEKILGIRLEDESRFANSEKEDSGQQND